MVKLMATSLKSNQQKKGIGRLIEADPSLSITRNMNDLLEAKGSSLFVD